MLFRFIFGVITEKLVGKTFKITMPRLFAKYIVVSFMFKQFMT